MSRIGRLPIPVPAGVDVSINGSEVTVTGPKGTLSHSIVEPIGIQRDDATLVVTRPDDLNTSRGLHGLTRTLIANMITGVTDGYVKPMEIRGVGYRVIARGNDLEFALGYSHPLLVPQPSGITFEVASPTRFVIRGIDKQRVGEVAANIRKLRKPDAYKGKGIRYEGEVVRLKEGKKGK